MPTYVFRDAKGSRYQVETEPGVSESQAFQLWQQRPNRAPSDTSVEDPTAGMSLAEKVAANFQAGARNLWPFGRTDASIAEKRRFDQQLADATPGGAVAQVAGEIVPTLAVPAGGALNAVRGGVNLGRAAMGADALAPMVARLGSGAAVADSAVAGGAIGALQPVTGNESRMGNTVRSAAGGAVIPGLAAGVGTAYRGLSQAGGYERAAQEIIDALGGQQAAGQVANRVAAYKPGAFVADVPLSTAEQAGDPTLARMQLASATRNDKTPPGPHSAGNVSWDQFKQGQDAQRWMALRDIAQPAGQVDQLTAARDAATAGPRNVALGRAGQDQWFQTPVAQAVKSMMSGPSGSNPAVQSVAGYVARELGNGVTPERLYTVRKVLAAKLGGPAVPGDTLAADAKQARSETMGLINSIDGALDQASGGAWSKYLQKYQTASGPVNDAQALGSIVEPFTREGATLNAQGVPVLTPANLGRQIENSGQNAFGDRLSYGSRDALGQLMENLRASSDLMAGVKRAGTQGGGSQSGMVLSDLAKAAGSEGVKGIATMIPGGRFVTDALSQRSDAFKRAALADALQNPDVFVRGVQAKLAQGQPLTNAEQTVLQVVRTAGILPAALPRQSATQ